MSEVAVIGDYDIRDKKLADAGTGTSVASTDAVVLKDTNGNYVEIDRDSFTDAIRSALGPILTNMTQKTAASGGVVVNDSNDVGTMNLSNLASVLSGISPLNLIGSLTHYNGIYVANRNLNNATMTGAWYCNGWDGNWSNIPEQATAVMIVFVTENNYIGQLFIGNNVYARRYNGSWGSWMKLNN